MDSLVALTTTAALSSFRFILADRLLRIMSTEKKTDICRIMAMEPHRTISHTFMLLPKAAPSGKAMPKVAAPRVRAADKFPSFIKRYSLSV